MSENLLSAPVGLRSSWSMTRTMITSAEPTVTGNISLRIGRTLPHEQRHEQVAYVTLTPEDARALYEALGAHLVAITPKPEPVKVAAMMPHADDPLSPCPDCGQDVPTIYTGQGYSGSPQCPKASGHHHRGHRVKRDALNNAQDEASDEVRRHYGLYVA